MNQNLLEALGTKENPMKNIIPLLIVLVIGFIGGYLIHGVSFFYDVTPAVVSENGQEQDQNGQQEEPAAPPPSSEVLYSQVLPFTSPAWALLSAPELTTTIDTLAELKEDETCSKIIDEFVASFPAGVTEVLSQLSHQTQEARLFMLPPQGDGPQPYLAGLIRESSPEVSFSSQFESTLTSQFPEAATKNVRVGEMDFTTMQTPIGELAYGYDAPYFWVCNQFQAMQRVFQTPPPPPAVEQPAPYAELLKTHSNAALALFINAANQGPALLAPPGWIPAFLSEHNIKQIAAFYQTGESDRKVTLLMQSDVAEPWVQEWLPISSFPFQQDDPAGLLEIALRWPGPNTLIDATESQSLLTQMFTNDKPNSRRNNPKPPRPNPRDGRRGPRNNQNPTPQNPLSGAFPFLLFSDMVPAGDTLGINVFGFYDGVPTLTFAIPDVTEETTFLNTISNIESVTVNETEIAMLPAHHYSFPENRRTEKIGLQNLIVMERDGITYLFDQKEAATHYMQPNTSNPENKNTRSKAMRDMLDNTKKTSQFQAVFSQEFFTFVLDNELSRFDPETQFAQDLQSIFETIKPHLTPLALSAGIEEQTWFIEAVADNDIALLMDSILVGHSTARLIQNAR